MAIKTKKDIAFWREINRGINSGRYFAMADIADKSRFQPAVFKADSEDTPSAWPEPGDKGMVVSEVRRYKTKKDGVKGFIESTRYYFYTEITPGIYSTMGWNFSDREWFEII